MKCHYPLIKMCGITNEADAQAAIALQVNYLGFVFYELSPRFIDPQHAAPIIATFPVSVLPVGLFVNHSEAEVVRCVKLGGVKILQFHGTESPSFCEKMSQQLGLPFWKAVHVAADTNSDDLLKSCLIYSSAQALLFDTASPGLTNLWGGTGHTFEWQKLAPLAASKNVPPLVLSGGLSAQNVAQGVATLNPWAVDVSSGIEAVDAQGKPRKGIKDPIKMADFVSAVRFI
jgi:phosphoribosylanthranilate isomerase